MITNQLFVRKAISANLLLFGILISTTMIIMIRIDEQLLKEMSPNIYYGQAGDIRSLDNYKCQNYLGSLLIIFNFGLLVLGAVQFQVRVCSSASFPLVNQLNLCQNCQNSVSLAITVINIIMMITTHAMMMMVIMMTSPVMMMMMRMIMITTPTGFVET